MSSFKSRIEDEARPGESWTEATARLLASRRKKSPMEGEQAVFFVSPANIAPKDYRLLMDVALFRMSKQQSRAGEVIRYQTSDGYVEVKAGPDGMASVWDYDIVLMLISHLTAALNLYKRGQGAMPNRFFTLHASDILKFCQRGDGGNQAKTIESALDRLKGTTIKSVRQLLSRTGKSITREVKSESLISSYLVMSKTVSGRVDRVEIEVPNWIYRDVIDSKGSAVLTINPDYFLIHSAIGRFIYRLARRSAGNDSAKWGFKTMGIRI